MPKPNKDKEYFKKVMEDNQKAFEYLFRKYYPRLCLYALNYVKDKDTAEDIVHNILVGIWNKRHQLNINTSVSSYLFTSTRNRCFNFINKQSVHTTFNDEIKNKLYYENEETKTEGSEIKKVLNEAINTLPKKCACIFRLSRFEGLSYNEIADYLGIASKTVETQMGIALKNLRRELLPYYKSLNL